jgi:hypothetical protein
MFDSAEVKKRKMEEAYARGVEKARSTGAVEGFLDSMASLVVPDSMGTDEYQAYQAGYKDFAGKVKRNNPPAQPEVPLDALEKAWYGLCNSSEFIPEETVRYYREQLFARRKHVTQMIGLSDFSEGCCPRCPSAAGHYTIHFLGQLKHPDCGTEWYIGPGSYIAFQLASIFHSGARAGGAMKSESDRKGEGGVGWLHAILGFLFVGICRAMLACVLIPIQAIVSLSQGNKASSQKT